MIKSEAGSFLYYMYAYVYICVHVRIRECTYTRPADDMQKLQMRQWRRGFLVVRLETGMVFVLDRFFSCLLHDRNLFSIACSTRNFGLPILKAQHSWGEAKNFYTYLHINVACETTMNCSHAETHAVHAHSDCYNDHGRYLPWQRFKYSDTALPRCIALVSGISTCMYIRAGVRFQAIIVSPRP